MNSETCSGSHYSNCYQWRRKPEEGGRGGAEATVVFTGGRRSSETHRRGSMLPGADWRRLQTRGWSSRRSTRRRDDLRAPASSWEPCGPRAMAGAAFYCRSDVSSHGPRRRRRGGGGDDSGKKGRNLKLMGGKAREEGN